VLTDDGLIVLGTDGGPLSVYDSADGRMLAELTIGDESGTYSTINTVSVDDHRYYVSTENDSDNTQGRLYAVDMVPSSGDAPLPYALLPAWHFDMHGPSASSPLRIGDWIYFDGTDADGHGVAYGVRDLGDSFGESWSFTLPVAAPLACSLSQDPRGGVWVLAVMWSTLYRLDEQTGQVVSSFDMSEIIPSRRDSVYIPGSQMTIAGDAEFPVMLLSAVGADGTTQLPTSSYEAFLRKPTYTAAVDLRSNTALWTVRLGRNVFTGPFTMGIHPIMLQEGRPVIAAGGIHSGVYFIR